MTPATSESSGIPVSIDFVMRPASAGDARKLAIFLDGWAYHKDRVDLDLRQRMALLASDNWDVWSFTWQDLNEKFGLDSTAEPLELAVPDQTKLKGMLQKVTLAICATIGTQSVFDWFEAELLGSGLPWAEIAKCALAARMTPARVVDAGVWQAFVERVAPPVAHGPLGAMMPHLITSDSGEISLHFQLMAIHDGAEPALVCALDDLEELFETRVPQLWTHATGRQPAPALNDRAFRPDPACDYSM